MRNRDGEWLASAGELAVYSQYAFRVRAVNDIGAGDWSAESAWTRTDADFSYEPLGDEESIRGTITTVYAPTFSQLGTPNVEQIMIYLSTDGSSINSSSPAVMRGCAV